MPIKFEAAARNFILGSLEVVIEHMWTLWLAQIMYYIFFIRMLHTYKTSFEPTTSHFF